MRQCKRLLAAVLIVVLYAAFGKRFALPRLRPVRPGSPVKRGSPLRMEKTNQKS